MLSASFKKSSAITLASDGKLLLAHENVLGIVDRGQRYMRETIGLHLSPVPNTGGISMLVPMDLEYVFVADGTSTSSIT